MSFLCCWLFMKNSGVGLIKIWPFWTMSQQCHGNETLTWLDKWTCQMKTGWDIEVVRNYRFGWQRKGFGSDFVADINWAKYCLNLDLVTDFKNNISKFKLLKYGGMWHVWLTDLKGTGTDRLKQWNLNTFNVFIKAISIWFFELVWDIITFTSGHKINHRRFTSFTLHDPIVTFSCT